MSQRTDPFEPSGWGGGEPQYGHHDGERSLRFCKIRSGRAGEIPNYLECNNDLHHIEIIPYDFLYRLQSWLAENKKADIWLHKI